jgi:hypothetical protein
LQRSSPSSAIPWRSGLFQPYPSINKKGHHLYK